MATLLLLLLATPTVGHDIPPSVNVIPNGMLGFSSFRGGKPLQLPEKNPDFLLKNPVFLLKSVDFIIK